MTNNSQSSKHSYFDLRLDRTGSGVTAAVTSSPAGQSSSPSAVILPAVSDLLQADSLPAADQIALGCGLWHGLFAQAEIAELWRSSNTSGRTLLRLTITDPALAALPWELLFDPRTAQFVVLDTRAALVRFVPLPIAASSVPADLPLRVLFTGSSPAGLPGLNVERERQLLWDALPGREMTLAGDVQSSTLSDLVAALGQGATLWHFAGHGVEQALIFEDGDGNPVHADAFTVGTLLAGAGVRVAVINACRAGAGGGAASSIAGALLRAGVPVVVAMQSAIPDTAAVVFSKTVYESIALGNSVEQATTAGRRAIFALGQVAGASWWIPALFSRSDDPVVLVERSSTGEGDTPTDHLAGAHTVASRNSAISQGGVAISGQVGGSVVVVSTSRT